MSDNKVITEKMGIDQLKQLITNIDKRNYNMLIIIKFTATWCKPCQNIKQLCDECFSKLTKNVVIVELDVDDNTDLYMFMKKKRIVSGIPAILVWKPNISREPKLWYIPDDSISGSSIKDIYELFNRCYATALTIQKNN